MSTHILCNIQNCKFNIPLAQPTLYQHSSTYIAIGTISTYCGECTKDDIIIEFEEKEVKGDYLIKYKLPKCKSMEVKNDR